MKHLLIAAHGSRRESSNEELKHLGMRVSAMLGVANNQGNVAFFGVFFSFNRERAGRAI